MNVIWEVVRHVPAATAFLAGPAILYQIDSDRSCVVNTFDRHLVIKLAAGGILFATVLLDIAVSVSSSEDTSSAAGLTLNLVGTMYLLWILYAEHKHSSHPYTLVSGFLAFDLVTSAIHWLSTAAIPGSFLIRMSMPTSLAAKVCILFFHEKSKWYNLVPEASRRMDQDQAYGFWSRCFGFSLFGQFSSKPNDGSLTIHINQKRPEAFEPLPFRKFTKAWNEHRKSSYRLLRATVYSLKQEVFLATLAVIFKTIFKVSIPFWIEAVTAHAQRQMSSKPIDDDSKGTNLILTTFCILFGWLASESCARYAISTVKLNLRSVLGEVVLEKLQKRPSETASQHAKLSLITDDLPSIADAASQLFQTLANVLEAVIVAFFACRENNFILLALAAHLTILTLPLKPMTIAASEAGARAVEKLSERSEAMATAVMSMQGAATLDQKAPLKSIVEKKRSEEKAAYEEARRLRVWPMMIQSSLNILSNMYMFAFDFIASESASVPSFFKTLTQGLFFRDATRFIIPSMQQFAVAMKAVHRVEQYLQQPSYEAEVRYHVLRDSHSELAVLFNNATISTGSDSNGLLENISMAFNRGTLSVITGDDKRNVLLQAAAGNCAITQGTVHLYGSVSYCGRDVWVPSKSIKDNIIGDDDYDADWFHQVVEACYLEHDILRLPGRSHFVATKGNTKLSISQLQRLALARCVYSRAAILILDDVLSCQDAASATFLLDELFSPGGLLRRGTTVLLSTENWQSFTNIGARFVSVDSSGQVTATTAAELLASQATLMPNPGSEMPLKQNRMTGSATQLMTQELLSNFRNEPPVANKSESARLSRYIGGLGLKPFVLAVVLLSIVVLLECFQYVLIFRWFQAGNLGSPPVYMSIACGILSGPFWAAAVWVLSMKVVQPSCDSLHERLLETILEAKYGFFTDMNTQRATRLVCEGFKTLSYIGYLDILYCIGNVFYMSFFLLFATYQSWFGLPLLVFLSIAFYFLHHFHYPIWQCLVRADTMARRALQAHFIDTSTGSAHIRALGWVLKNVWHSRRCLDRYRQTSVRIESLERWLLFVSDFLVVSMLILGMLASLWRDVEPYRLGLYLFAVLTVGDCINYFLDSLKGLRNQLCILKEMEDFIETTPREVQAIQLLKDEPEEKEREDLGDIKFTEASISYGPKGVNVLENITMTIPKGSHFGVFGEAQSGKSALLLALCGLLPYTGSITLNGREIRDIPRSRLLEIFAILPETPVVFPGATILQTLFPSEILDPGKSERHQGAMSLLLFRLGLKAMIDEIGGLEAKFEDLHLTSDQMHLFSLARLIGQHLYGRGSIFLIDGVTGKVGLETHTRMRLAIRDFLPQGETTMIYTFGYNQLVLHSTHLSQIVEKNIIPVPLGVPGVAA